MSFEEVQSKLTPAIKVKPKKNGQGTIFESFVEREPPVQLSEIQAFWLRLFNNKVYQIEIFYKDSERPPKLEDFVNQLTGDLNVPPGAWTIRNGRAELHCGEFRLNADAVLNRHIELTDHAAYTAFRDQLKQEKTEKKKS